MGVSPLAHQRWAFALGHLWLIQNRIFCLTRIFGLYKMVVSSVNSTDFFGEYVRDTTTPSHSASVPVPKLPFIWKFAFFRFFGIINSLMANLVVTISETACYYNIGTNNITFWLLSQDFYKF